MALKWKMAVSSNFASSLRHERCSLSVNSRRGSVELGSGRRGETGKGNCAGSDGHGTAEKKLKVS